MNNAEYNAVELHTFVRRIVLLCTEGHTNVFNMNAIIHTVDVAVDKTYVLMNYSWRWSEYFIL
jgi:hypothetical protein